VGTDSCCSPSDVRPPRNLRGIQRLRHLPLSSIPSWARLLHKHPGHIPLASATDLVINYIPDFVTTTSYLQQSSPVALNGDTLPTIERQRYLDMN
jgi:hypothetical protein